MKKLISILLVAAMILSLSVMAFAKTEMPEYNFTRCDFKDVSKGDWYYTPVCYCANGGGGCSTGVDTRSYVSGYGGSRTGYFGPADYLQRQDFAIILYRFGTVQVPYDLSDPRWSADDLETLSSENALIPTPYKPATQPWNIDQIINSTLKSKGQLKDIRAGEYYTEAVNALRALGFVAGYDNGYFGVGDKITREQVVTMIYRYEGVPEITDEMREKFNAYSDSNKTSLWAKDAFAWAISNGIIKGMNATTLAPQKFITRAEVATIIMRLDSYHHVVMCLAEDGVLGIGHGGLYMWDNQFDQWGHELYGYYYFV